jgi:hypothetical protein
MRSKFNFGKYLNQNKTVKEVIESDAQYMNWVLNLKNFRINISQEVKDAMIKKGFIIQRKAKISNQ